MTPSTEHTVPYSGILAFPDLPAREHGVSLFTKPSQEERDLL